MPSALDRVPAWALLGGIVVVSAALRIWLVRGMVAPFVFVDELIYSELAKSLADGGSFAVRELPTSGYSILYPALIAPAYVLFDRVPDAYTATKTIDAVTMSLAAVPAYLLARRVTGRWLALLGATIAVAVPSMAYTATITTESLFYPVTLAFALALAAYLAQPGWARLAALVLALVVAFATRSQALAFVPAIATAPLVLAALRRRLDVLRPFVPLYALGVGSALALVALQALRGRSLAELLGAYSIVGEGGYDAGQVVRFWLWHVEELDLYVGILPLAAVLLLLLRGRSVPLRVQEHLAVTGSLLVWSTLAVGAFASRFASDRIQDRYLFFLAPLLAVCLLAWVELGAPRPLPQTAAALGIALVLPLLFPYVRFIGEPAKSDTLGLVPLWSANEHLLAGRYWATVAAIGLALVGVLTLVPARYAVAAPLAVLALFVVLSRPVWSGPHGFLVAGKGALSQGIRSVGRNWIDRAVPAGEEVVVLWTGGADRFTVNQNEFFNRSIGRVFYTDAPTPGGIAELLLTRARAGDLPVDREGVFFLPNDAVVDAPYALLDGSVTPDGEVVTRDEGTGMTLWRLTGPLSSRALVEGIYPGDTWSGPRVRWRLLRCKPGTLTVIVHSDASLVTRPQRLTAWSGSGASLVRTTIHAAPSDQRSSLQVPVTPGPNGSCRVELRMTTAVPSEVLPGSNDDRELGLHFDAFAYTPSR